MSEHAPDQNPEHLKGFEELAESAEHMLPKGEIIDIKKHERARSETLVEARAQAAETAQSETKHDALKQLEAAEDVPQVSHSNTLDAPLRALSFHRQIIRIQHKLPAAQRVLSKVIHQPAVRVVSEVAEKTVSRPSGLLGGGLVAFLGSSSYLYLAKHIGFNYNHFVAIALFVGGFIAGLILELIVHFFAASRRASN